MNKTPIEWTDWSVNPFKLRIPDGTLINACVHKSAGCAHCYAEGIVRRWWKKESGEFPGYTPALLKLGVPVLVEDELKAVLSLSRRISEGKAAPEENKIFWNDMTDEFLEFWPDGFIDKIFAVRALTPNLIHQVLTKRAERMQQYFASFWSGAYAEQRGLDACLWADKLTDFTLDVGRALERIPSGLPNVHLGVSVEDQQTADERIPWLLKTPAAVRWVSYEPALGPVDFSKNQSHQIANGGFRPIIDDLDWIIVGGESGPGARPFDIQWARDAVAQCKAAAIPCFVKQLGAKPVYVSGNFPPGTFTEHSPDGGYSFGPLKLKNKKGGDINEFPEVLRVREFPTGGASV